MNERLTLHDLIDFLAKKQGITKKDAESFLRELVAVILDNIEEKDSIKIKDFGVFKPVKVNARKSVDVNTGEDIEIPAHYKLSFTPDKSLKEAVNRPFSHFESVVIEEGISFDNLESYFITEEENEESDIIITEAKSVNEPRQEPVIEKERDNFSARREKLEKEEVSSSNKKAPENTKRSEPILVRTYQHEYNKDAFNEPVVTNKKTEESIDKADVDKKEKPASWQEDQPVIEHPKRVIPASTISDQTRNDEDEIPEALKFSTKNVSSSPDVDYMAEIYKSRTRRRRYFTLGFFVVLIVIGFFVGGMYFQEILNYITKGSSDDRSKSVIDYTKEDSTRLNNTIIFGQDSLLKGDNLNNSTQPNQQTGTVTPPTPENADVNKPLATEVLKRGETLRSIAGKYYGNKVFWVYIYQENKAVISNPNSIDLGTKLVIPSTAKYGIDAKSSTSIQKANELQSQIVTELGL